MKNNQLLNKSMLAAGNLGKQRGFTIVELSIAVAIAGVLLVGSVSLVQTVLNTARANDSITSLARTITQIEKTWSSANDYAGLSLASAAGAGAFEGLQKTVVAGVTTAVRNKFNRDITVSLNVDLPSAGASRGYAMAYKGIPTSVCTDIVSSSVNAGIRGLLIIPETTAAGVSTDVTGLTLSNEAFATIPTGAVVAFQPATPAMNIANVTGTAGCGTDKATVTLVFVNYK
jgi:prepilin-type N-terminal cleavage/methylation domain-containing protein